jgi:HlyD family secretion protein
MDQLHSPETLRLASRKKLAIAVLLVLGLLGAVWGTNRGLSPSLALREIKVSQVRRGNISNTINASGVVIPVHEQQVSSPSATRITEVLVKAGQEVQAGQLLLKLDARALTLSMENLQEQIDQQDNLSKRLSLELTQKLKGLASEIELLELDLASAKVMVERHQKMRAIGATSASDFAAAQLAVRKLEVQLRQHREAIQDNQRVTQTTLAGASLQRVILQKQREQTQTLIDETQVKAPISGMLTWLMADAGASLASGQMLAKVSELHNFRVEATMSDFYARFLSTGQSVCLGYSGEVLRGTVHLILPEIQDGTLKLLINLDQPGHPLLRDKLRVDVNIVTEEKNNVLLVDNGVALNGQGPQGVYVITNGVAQKRTLDLGLSDGEHVEVRNGALAGERIIVSETNAFKHLDRIRVHK